VFWECLEDLVLASGHNRRCCPRANGAGHLVGIRLTDGRMIARYKSSCAAVTNAFSILGVVTALRFIESICRNHVFGQQRPVLYNLVNGALVGLRGLSAVGMMGITI
jgi:hypothetical protein